MRQCRGPKKPRLCRSGPRKHGSPISDQACALRLKIGQIWYNSLLTWRWYSPDELRFTHVTEYVVSGRDTLYSERQCPDNTYAGSDLNVKCLPCPVGTCSSGKNFEIVDCLPYNPNVESIRTTVCTSRCPTSTHSDLPPTAPFTFLYDTPGVCIL